MTAASTPEFPASWPLLPISDLPAPIIMKKKKILTRNLLERGRERRKDGHMDRRKKRWKEGREHGRKEGERKDG